MGLFRPSRTARATRWLEWKVRLFVVGAVLGLAGIFLDERGLVTAALVTLAVGAALRLLPEKSEGDDPRPDDDEDMDQAPAEDHSSAVASDEHGTR